MRATSRDLASAVSIMSGVIRGFPQNVEGQAFVTHAIEKFVSTREQLHWLVETACERMRWFSLPELRGIFCSRFRPADGVEGYCAETPGLTAGDQEAAYYERVGQETQAKLLQWNREQRLLPAPEEKLELPVLRDIAEPAKLPKPERKQLSPPGTVVTDEELKAAMEMTPRRSDEENNRLLAELQSRLFEKSGGGLIQ